ncbi:hypothetical protein AB0U58_23915, partial [Escherichia coli]
GTSNQTSGQMEHKASSALDKTIDYIVKKHSINNFYRLDVDNFSSLNAISYFYSLKTIDYIITVFLYSFRLVFRKTKDYKIC